MTTTINAREDLKRFVLDAMPAKNDYTILMEGDLERIITALIELEEEYIDSIVANDAGELEYDDQKAFETLTRGLKSAFPQYETFCEAMVDDYMDLSEDFLTQIGQIEWE